MNAPVRPPRPAPPTSPPQAIEANGNSVGCLHGSHHPRADGAPDCFEHISAPASRVIEELRKKMEEGKR